MKHRSTRRIAAVISALVLSGLSPLLTADPAAADGADRYGKPCDPNKYKERYEITSLTVEPVITYQASYVMGSYERWGSARKVVMDRKVSVEAGYRGSASASVEVSLPAKLLGAVNAATSLEFEAKGSVTLSKTVTTRERREFRNPDERNRKVIFYQGLTRAKGTVTRKKCAQHYLPGQSYGPYEVHLYDGRYETWTDNVGLSHLICGYGAPGALAKLVRARYCDL
ncbi:hypothetical protein [Nocardioides sp.]|uniref:hypothetical protein n=1 Tax=Nocardioides sp. TaxID=35761 RepID=UPI003515A483